MKLVTWNCGGGFTTKFERLLNQSPDIAIIQECDLDSLSKLPSNYKFHFTPVNSSKGLAVIWREPWNVLSLGVPAADVVLGFEVEGPLSFRLVAVWACRLLKGATYTGELHRALTERPEWFSGNVVMAGDFNSNSRWDSQNKKLSHTAAVEKLSAFGLQSVYHALTNDAHGEEVQHTFSFRYHLDEPFHIDFIFLSEEMLKRVSQFSIEPRDQWLSSSDHAPLILELAT